MRFFCVIFFFFFFFGAQKSDSGFQIGRFYRVLKCAFICLELFLCCVSVHGVGVHGVGVHGVGVHGVGVHGVCVGVYGVVDVVVVVVLGFA